MKTKEIMITPAEELTRKQRMVIKKRLVIKKPPKLFPTIIAAVLLLAFIMGFGYVVPKPAAAAPATTGSVLTMDFVGDVMLGRNIRLDGEMHGYEKYYEGVRAYWQNADLAFANMESAVLKDGETYTKAKKTKNSIYLAANYAGLESLSAAGINMLSCANNHAGDYSRKPIYELCDYLDAHAGTITYAGIGRNIDEAANYKVVTRNGIRIGFVSLTETYYNNAAARPDLEGVFTTTYTAFNRVVSDAAKMSDILVVYIHFGEENQTASNDEQRTYAHHLIEAGADIVIGSHPHVLQDVELYNGGIIFYSLGNFIFDQGSTYARDSVLVQYTLDSAGTGAFELIPVRINDGIPQLTKMAFYAARINRELSQSLTADSYYYNEEGHIVIPAVGLDLRASQGRDANENIGTDNNEED